MNEESAKLPIRLDQSYAVAGVEVKSNIGIIVKIPDCFHVRLLWKSILHEVWWDKNLEQMQIQREKWIFCKYKSWYRCNIISQHLQPTNFVARRQQSF